MLISLVGVALVILLTYWSCRWLAKRMGAPRATAHLRVVDRLMLGQDRFLVIVQVQERYLLLGVTGHQINQICELDDSFGATVAQEPLATEKTFASYFNTWLQKGLQGNKGAGKQDDGRE